MRKLMIIGLMAAVAAPAAVSAQSVGEVRRSQQEVREQQRDLQQARRYGDRDDVRDERRDVQAAKQELREDRRDMRQAGNSPRVAYVAPVRGWRYRPVTTGYRLQPAFYGSRYVIANPVQYRLPVAARNQQWIRYGDDLVLVNVRNGRVIQAVRGRY